MISRVIVKFGLAGPAVLALLLLASSSVAWGLSTITKDTQVSSLLLFSSLGVLTGWLFAARKIKPRWAILIALVTSLIFFLVQDSNFLIAISDILNTTISFISRIIDEPTILEEEIPSLLSNAREIILDLSSPFTRLVDWVEKFVNSEDAYDPFVTRILWTSILWLTTLWAGYYIRYKSDPIIAMAPSGVLLAGSLNYVNGDALTILLFITASLLLIPLLHYKKRQQTWINTGTDYAEDIALDTGLVTLPIILLLLMIGTFIPVFRIRQLLLMSQDFYQTYAEEAENIGEMLGLEVQPEMSAGSPSVQSPGLPREHLLGSGPELNQQLVMVIEVDDPSASIISHMDIQPRYYWRGVTYNQYTGLGWDTSPVEEFSYLGGETIFEDIPVSDIGARLVVQDVRRIRDSEVLAYAAGTIVRSDQDYKIGSRVTDGDTFDIFAGTIEADNYRVISLLTQLSDEQLSSTRGEIPTWVLERYLQLPASLPRRVRRLAQEITHSKETPFEKAKSIEAYLRKYEYSLEVSKPPPDRDVTDYFLFDLRQGYCDYYATAMVVLARSIGIPARLVIGYATGSYDDKNDHYIITEANAHSWPELYLPGAGWVEFEPTGGLPIPERPNWDTPAIDIQELSPARKFDLFNFIQTISSQGIYRFMVILTPILLGCMIWLFGESIMLRVLPPKKSIRYAFRLLYRQAASLTLPNYFGDTPNEFSNRLQMRLQQISVGHQRGDFFRNGSKELQDLVNLYNLTLYSPQPTGEVEKSRVLSLRWYLRWRISSAKLKYNLTNVTFFRYNKAEKKVRRNKDTGK